MSTLCLNYYRFLENTLDLNKILTKLNSDCDDIMSWCLQHDFINCSVNELIDQFPKYLDYSRFLDIKKLSSLYNHELIYNATTMSYSQLRSVVSKDPSLFPIELKIKHTPENIEDQIKEYLFQTNYSTSIDDLLFNKNFYYNNYNNVDYSNRFANLLNALPESDLSDLFRITLNRHSFFHLYFINSLVNYIIKNRTDLKETLVSGKNFETPTIDSGGIDYYFENIVDIVLKNQFSFVNITDNFKEELYQSSIIQESVSKIGDLFDDYVNTNTNADLFKTDTLDTVFEIIIQNISFNFTNSFFSLNSNFNFDKINTIFSYNSFGSQEAKELLDLYLVDLNFTGNNLSNFENDLYIFHVKTLNNNYSMRNYYYLLYLYRNNLQRFVNVIDMIATEYISNNIHYEGISHFSTFENMSNLFKDWCTCIRYPVFNLNLNKVITSEKAQTIFDNDLDILRMSHTYAYQKQIESFVKTDGFKTQVNTIQNDIYTHLRSGGILSGTESVDWCDCTQPLEIYLFFALKDMVKENHTEGYSYFSSYSETSITVNSDKTGEQLLIVDTGLNITTGDTVKIIKHTIPISTECIDYMITTVVSYDSSDGELVVDIVKTVSSNFVDKTYSSWAVINLPKTYDYVTDKLTSFHYKQFVDKEEFELLTTNFNIKNSYYSFEFYKAFIKSLLVAVFSEAVHLKYGL
jgi:hypothetical protein